MPLWKLSIPLVLPTANSEAEYDLLPPSPTSNKRGRKGLNKAGKIWRLVCLGLIVFDIMVVIIWLIRPEVRGFIRIERRPPAALDNFQNLNSISMIDSSAFDSAILLNPKPYNLQEHAVVTTMYTDNYILPIVTLGYTLQEHNITARQILMYLPDKISKMNVCIAEAAGWELFPVDLVPPPHDGVGTLPHYMDQYTKLNLWKFDKLGIKSLVYLDADTIVRNNFDELFMLPYNFAATPDIWLDSRGFTIGFNAGVMFLRPNTATFEDMVAKKETANYTLAFAEQAFLNAYFGSQALRLPLAYNGNLAVKVKSRLLWEELKKDLRTVHYTLAKPFPARLNPLKGGQTMEGFFKESLGAWGGIWEEELTWWYDASKSAKKTFAGKFAQCKSTGPIFPE